MANKKQTPAQALAKRVGAKVVQTKHNARIALDGKTIATVWTRGNGSLTIYAHGEVQPTGALKKATKQTSEGLRLKIDRELVERGELPLADELVALACDAELARRRGATDEHDTAVAAS